MPPASTRGAGGGGGPSDASDGATAAAAASAASVVPLAASSSPPSSSPPPTTPGVGSAAGTGAGSGRRKRPSSSPSASATTATATTTQVSSPASASAAALEAVGFSSVAVTGSLHRARPAFNTAGDTVACASGTSVLLLATGTGEILTRLQGGHTRPISALAFSGGRHLFTAGVDGVLQCWEVQGAKAPRVVHTHRFDRELLALSPNPTDSNIVYLALGEQLVAAEAAEAAEANQVKGGKGNRGKGKGKYRIIEYALAGGGKRSKVLSFKSPPLFLEATRDGQFVVAACAARLCVWSAREKELWTCVAFDDKTPREGSLLQAVALNPAKPEVATGDVNGRVYLWPTLFQKLGTALAQGKAQRLSKQKQQKQAGRRLFRAEVRRWHAHGVSALAYSPDGHYLLSGGPEAVLVLCQLARGNHTMTFLPRLGAPVAALALSANGLRCALATAANTLLLVRPMDLAIGWQHKALAHAPEAEETASPSSSSARLWAAPPSAARLLGGPQLLGNCLPGRLQLLDAGSGVVRAEVEAVPTNVAVSSRSSTSSPSSADPTAGVAPPCVTHAAMAGDGCVVATVERRVGEEGLQRTSLKFWERDAGAHRRRVAVTATAGAAAAAGQGYYGLAAVVDRPHEAQAQGRLLSLAYHPRLDLVASSSEGGAFSLWARLGVDEEAEGGEEARDGPAGAGARPRGRGRGRWVCQATVPFKRGPARCVAFSPDGSLLAVGCGPAIALWDPLAVRLLTVLSDPCTGSSSSAANDVAALHFLPNAPRLVCATRGAVTVWDLLTLAPAQRYEAPNGGEWGHLTAVGAGASLALGVGGEAVHFAAVLWQGGKGGSRRQQQQQQQQQQQTVVAFNAFKAQPLLTYPLPAAAPPLLGLALAEGQAHDDGAEAEGAAGVSGGLYYMTREGVTLVAPSAVCQRLHRRRRPLAGGVKRPPQGGAVAALELKGGSKRPRLSAASSGAEAAGGRGAGDRAATVAELLGTTTGLLPPPSAVFDAFLAGLLPTRLAVPSPAAAVVQQHGAAGAGRSPSKQEQQREDAAAAAGARAAMLSQQAAAPAAFPAPLPTAKVRKDLMRLLAADFVRASSQAPAQQAGGQEVEEVVEAPTMNGGEKTPSSSAKAKAGRSLPSSSGKKQRRK